MKYVYLLQSIPHPEQRYVGLTSDPEKRLSAHNSGQSPHTSKFRPWKLITCMRCPVNSGHSHLKRPLTVC
jgi:putative endonuclease